MRKLAAAALCAAFLAACTRPQPKQPANEAPAAPPPAEIPAAPVPSSKPAPSLQTEGVISYIPAKERALYAGDAIDAHTEWRALGLEFPELLKLSRGKGVIVSPATLYSGEAALTEAGSLAPLTAITILGSTDWESTGARYRKLYHVKAETQAGPVSGWVDSSTCAIVIASAAGLSAGVVERKIVISDGDSRYSVLLIEKRGSAFLVDMSAYLFPDAFHPGGIVSADIEDVNSDGKPEIVVQADFIVSFSYLGASPLRAEIWLQERGGSFAPVLKFNKSFGTDEGFEYSATRTVLDTDGDGFRETVKVVTEHQQQSGTGGPFRSTLVSFYVYNGSEYAKDASQDLPKLGTVSGPVTLQREPGSTAGQAAAGAGAGTAAGASAGAAPAAAADAAPSDKQAALTAGETVFVFDRSGTSEPGDGGRVFWYKVLAKDGREGWLRGTDLSMEWVDPYKMNRQAFLGEAGVSGAGQ